MDLPSLVMEIAIAISKYGWTVAALLSIIYSFYKYTPLRKLVMRHLPKKLRKIDIGVNDVRSSVNELKVQMDHMESKLDAILHAGGITWAAPSNDGKDASEPTTGRHGWWTSQRADTSHVDTVKSSTTRTDRIYQLQKWWRGLNMSKLKSRKFWMAIVGALLIVLNDGLNIGVDQETVLAFAGLIASYIFGEAAADVAKAKANGGNDAQSYGDSGSAE